MGITNDLIIEAGIDRVWELTVDVEGWPSLTPTMTSVERLDSGPLEVGSSARVVQPRQRPTTWTVTRLEPRSLFEWQAKVGTVTMTATHRLSPSGDACRNSLEVTLTGFGSGILRRLVGSKIREAIETENAGFKAVAERSVDEADEPAR
jgi:uncharacterized membrane protein